jgi:hypothetical protein
MVFPHNFYKSLYEEIKEEILSNLTQYSPHTNSVAENP